MACTFRFLSGHDNWRLGSFFVRRVDAWEYHVIETHEKEVGKGYRVSLWHVDIGDIVEVRRMADAAGLSVNVVGEWRIAQRNGMLLALGEDAVRAVLVDRFVRAGLGQRIIQIYSACFDDARRKARIASVECTNVGFTRCPACGQATCTPGCPG